MKDNKEYGGLIERLRGVQVAAVAFSGGSDSMLLLVAAREALGSRVMAFTVVTPFMERQEIADTLALAGELGVRHELVELDTPTAMESNPRDRCYMCKRALFERLMKEAHNAGFPRVLDGSNLDDLNNDRPGLRALRELGIESPLLECRLTKEDIRRISSDLGLSTRDKLARGCLLTRLPIGGRVTIDDLQLVEEAERLLRSRGYPEVRVLMRGQVACIEVEEKLRRRVIDESPEIVRELEALGFRYVTLDLSGHPLGGMNPDCA